MNISFRTEQRANGPSRRPLPCLIAVACVAFFSRQLIDPPTLQRQQHSSCNPTEPPLSDPTRARATCAWERWLLRPGTAPRFVDNRSLPSRSGGVCFSGIASLQRLYDFKVPEPATCSLHKGTLSHHLYLTAIPSAVPLDLASLVAQHRAHGHLRLPLLTRQKHSDANLLLHVGTLTTAAHVLITQ